MVEREDTNLKTFNTAKVFSEQILFPLMFDYKKFQRQANFGTEKLDESIQLTEEIREIQRFNGLKGMAETTYDLCGAITSTVKLKGNKEEITQLNLLSLNLERIKELFYSHKERFFIQGYKGQSIIETLDREYFNKIKKLIEISYINVEILMTRNKLLFSDASDEFTSDEEIREQIKKEYIES